MRLITESEVQVHGIHYSDYFQGAGVCKTRFDDIATGIGSSEKEALEDALESLAQNGWDTEGFETRNVKVSDKEVRLNDEQHVYVSVLVK